MVRLVRHSGDGFRSIILRPSQFNLFHAKARARVCVLSSQVPLERAKIVDLILVTGGNFDPISQIEMSKLVKRNVCSKRQRYSAVIR